MLLGCWMLLAPTASFALDPARSLFQYNCQSWTHRDGLPVNRVSSIVQAPEGYLWLGSQKGLVCFDGLNFKLIALPARSEFPSQAVSCLSSCRDGGVWFGVSAGSFGHYDGNSFRGIQRQTWMESGMNVISLLETKDFVWIGLDAGAARMSKVEGNATAFFEQVGSCTSIYEDSKGRIWLGTAQHGLFYWQDGEVKNLPDETLKKSIIFAITEDRQGFLRWEGQAGAPGPFLGRTDLDRAHHARLEVAGNQAGIVEFARPGELPHQRPGLSRRDVHHAGLAVMIHAGLLAHRIGMVLQVLHRAEHHFVHHLARVLQPEAHRLALLHRQLRRSETHGVAHVEIDGSRHLLRIAFLAEGLFGRVVAGMALRGSNVRECAEHGADQEGSHRTRTSAYSGVLSNTERAKGHNGRRSRSSSRAQSTAAATSFLPVPVPRSASSTSV